MARDSRSTSKVFAFQEIQIQQVFGCFHAALVREGGGRLKIINCALDSLEQAREGWKGWLDRNLGQRDCHDAESLSLRGRLSGRMRRQPANESALSTASNSWIGNVCVGV